jgi:hypothetical protein
MRLSEGQYKTFGDGKYAAHLVCVMGSIVTHIGFATVEVVKVDHYAEGTDYTSMGTCVVRNFGTANITSQDFMAWRRTGYDPQRFNDAGKSTFIVSVGHIYLYEPTDMEAVDRGYNSCGSADIEIMAIENEVPYSPVICQVI